MGKTKGPPVGGTFVLNQRSGQSDRSTLRSDLGLLQGLGDPRHVELEPIESGSLRIDRATLEDEAADAAVLVLDHTVDLAGVKDQLQ